MVRQHTMCTVLLSRSCVTSLAIAPNPTMKSYAIYQDEYPEGSLFLCFPRIQCRHYVAFTSACGLGQSPDCFYQEYIMDRSLHCPIARNGLLSRAEGNMNCLRCNSPMCSEQYDDLQDTQGQGFLAMHCLMCGDIVDPVILDHRRNRVAPRARQARLAVVISTSATRTTRGMVHLKGHAVPTRA